MSRAAWRQSAVLVLAALLLFCYPASAGERDLSAWLWFMRFDGTPNAVRERFNALARDQAEEGQFAAWDRIPSASTAAVTNGDAFAFFDREPAGSMTAGPVQFRITGERTERGLVERLQIDIEPSAGFSQDYLTGCDQLAQICAQSLFDGLDDRATRTLLLALLYDLRPFGYHDQSPLKPRTRTLSTVVDDVVVDMEWAVEAGDAMRFSVALAGEPSEAQRAAAQLNNHCNRLLGQTSDECGSLLSCLREMAAPLDFVDAFDWADLSAAAGQAQETLVVVQTLQSELGKYEKAADYAAQLGDQLQLIEASIAAMADALSAQNEDALVTSLNDSIDLSAQAHRLISIIRAR